MFARTKIDWLVALILMFGFGAAGVVRFSARTGLAQQAICYGSGDHPEERPVLEDFSQDEARAGEEVVLTLYGGGYSQVEGVDRVYFGDYELPVQECAVISPAEMQVRIFFPEDTPIREDVLVIILIADSEEAYIRSVFRVVPPGEVPQEGFPTEERFPPEEVPPDDFGEPGRPQIPFDPIPRSSSFSVSVSFSS